MKKPLDVIEVVAVINVKLPDPAVRALRLLTRTYLSQALHLLNIEENLADTASGNSATTTQYDLIQKSLRAFGGAPGKDEAAELLQEVIGRISEFRSNVARFTSRKDRLLAEIKTLQEQVDKLIQKKRLFKEVRNHHAEPVQE